MVVADRQRRGRGTGHGGGGAAGNALGVTKAIGVAGRDCNGLADFGWRQCVGGRRGAADGSAIGKPVVADGAQAIGIGQGVVGGQHFALRGAAGDGDRAGGCVIDVGHGRGRAAGYALGVTKTVGVAGLDCDRLADFGLRQGVASRSGAADRSAIGKPAVADGAQTIGIGQGVVGGQHFALRGGAGDGDDAAGCVVDCGIDAEVGRNAAAVVGIVR